MDPVFAKKGPFFINSFIKTILGVKDPYLRLDEENFDNPIEDQPSQIIVHLIQTYPMHYSKCGHLVCKNGYRTVNCLGPEFRFKPTIWSIKKQKYICKASSSCPEVVTKLAAVGNIHYRNHISLAIKQRAMMLLTKNESQSNLAKGLNVSDWTIRRVVANLDQFFKPSYHWLPHHTALDSFKSGRFAPSGMSMILINIENRRTLDIILPRKNSYLRKYFLQYDRSACLAVQTITVDLYTPYRHLIHEFFPRALIIADHLHIIAQAYRAFNRIRIQVMNRTGAGTHKWCALKRFWKLLLTPANKLKYDNYWSGRSFSYTQLTDVEVIHRLLSLSNELKRAYEYYQNLILVVAHRSRKESENLFAIKWTRLPQALQKVQRTPRRYKQEIYNSFRYDVYTNGPVEGTNNKVKVIKRTVYGFRNFFNFRVRILLALSNTYIAINRRNKQATYAKVQAQAA